MFPSPDQRVHCLLESLHAYPGLADGVAPARLLSRAEQARCDGFVVAKRRREWLLGRWTAKHLVQSYLAQTRGLLVPLDQLEIRAGEDGAPYAWVGERLPVSLSISHSGSDSFCALCDEATGQAGADVEQIEPRTQELVYTFFTPAEIAAVEAAAAGDRDALITAVWSAKEAVLKTLHLGLRADTRQVDVTLSILRREWCSFAAKVEPALLPSPHLVLSGWCLMQSSRVLSLALLN